MVIKWGLGEACVMTQKEIAQLANVSEAAVCIALNNRKGVSDETRQRIINIASSNGYRVKSKRREREGVNRKNIRFLACIDDRSVDRGFSYAPFFELLIQNMTIQCNELGHNLLMSSINLAALPEELKEIEREAPSDGIILLGTNLNEQEIRHILRVQKNLVVLDNLANNINVDCVTMNNAMGGRQAAEHLLRMGHVKIGYAQSESISNNLTTRRQAFTEALCAHRVELARDWYVSNVVERATQGFLDILNREKDELPTAFACENDYTAIALIKALQEAGYRVPDDVSVIGFDNIPNAAIISPELTTINVYTQAMCKIAMDCIGTIMEKGKLYSCKYLVDTMLVKRNSIKNLLNKYK